MERTVPRILYVCTPSHTRKVFRPEDYTRLQTHFDVHANSSERNYTSEQLANEIAGYDALLTGWGAPRITQDAMARADRLRLIAHSAGSVRGMLNDVADSIMARDIAVFSANRAIAYNVSEATVGYMIMASRRWFDHMSTIRSGGWSKSEVPSNGQYLRGSTVGIVSASTVARELIELLRPFGVEIILYDPLLSEYDAGVLGVELVQVLEDLFARADFLTVHAPSIPETDRMVGARELAHLRDGAVFVNTSRGSVVDHEALYHVARSGRIQVVLDVTTPEPLPPDHPLRSLTNVFITPHVSGAGYYGYFKIGELTTAAIENYFAGKPFEGRVDMSRWAMLA
ncbi:hydroxyacid dehydrogenase [Candidatus Poribacteria bacterium]|nr:hydroxyacid dehydrogenase [Candidatus Poribacteria bacterium]